MATPNEQSERGFTSGEKWIIWGVFCLLVGLSTSRFTVFAGLMLIPLGIYLGAKKHKHALGLIVGVFGLLGLVFSRFLI